MQENPRIPMGKTGKIIRNSINTLLQNYQYFTSKSALFALPFSVSILIAQAFVPSSFSLILKPLFNHLKTLFDSQEFTPFSDFFTIINKKLSQIISSSIFTIPFTLTFLLITKASVIQALNNQQKKNSSSSPNLSSITSLYNPLLLTSISSSFLVISANATVFFLIFFASYCLEGLGISSSNYLLLLFSSGAVLYSVLVANAVVISNLALVLSGMERCGGLLAIVKACVLIKGRTSTALSLALPVNLALAAIEALFQYRVVSAYHVAEKPVFVIVLEGILIAYLYSVLIVLDTIVNCLFFKSCGTVCHMDVKKSWQIDYLEEDDDHFYVNSNNSEKNLKIYTNNQLYLKSSVGLC